MTQQPFTDTLNEALERLAQGATVEECLALYGEAAAELEPLLRVAQATISARPVPRPEAQRATLERLIQGWQEQQAGKGQRRFPLRAALLRPWAVAIVAVLALLLTGWGTSSAAANSVPGDTLYPVKTAQERLVLAVTPSSSRKARLHARLAGERAEEMVVLAAREHNGVSMDLLAQRMARHTQKAVVLVVVRLEAPPPATSQPPASPTVTPPPKVRKPVDPSVRRARAEMRRLLAQHEKLQEQGYRDLPSAKRQRFQEAFRNSQRELHQAVVTLEQLEAEDQDEREEDDDSRGNKRGKSGKD
jgi:hypothetical protein